MGTVETLTDLQSEQALTIHPPHTTDTIAARLTGPPPCTGVRIVPGDNVAAKITAAPAGSTFCFQPGTYVLTAPIIPKSGSRLISVVPRGAILTGLDVHNAGIRGYGGAAGQRDVTVDGFVIKGFKNVIGTSAQVAAVQCGDNWTVTNNEIANNGQSGVALNSGTVLRGNFIHHNGRYGFGGGPAITLLIENNEVSFNNLVRNDTGNAGGSKIIKSSNVTVRANHVHDNYGNGLHSDTDVLNIIYENNNVHDNWGGGIFHECSADAVIRNNTLARNNLKAVGKSLFYGADLFLNSSKNVEVYGNVIVAGVHGLGLYDSNRGAGPYGLYEVRNVNVHDNTVTVPAGGMSGMVGGTRPAVYTTGGNRFVNNKYKLTSPTVASWQWNGIKTWAQWRALGNDLTGTVQ